MKILLTGAAGLLGRCVTPLLLAAEHELHFLDLREPPLSNQGVFFAGSITDPALCLAAAKGCEAIIHAGAWHDAHRFERTEREYFEVNVGGTYNVLEAATANDVKVFVYASSVNVERAWDRFYTSTKICGEELCRSTHRKNKTRVAIMRYWAFGDFNFQRADDLREYGQNLLFVGVHCDDAAQATLNAITQTQYDFGVFCIAPDRRIPE